MVISREQRLVATAVDLADTSAADFDITGVLYNLTASCVELLDVDTSGVLLADDRGDLQTVASSHEQTQHLELFQLQVDQGACVDCYKTGAPISSSDLEHEDRWPAFTARARAQGVASVHAVPMSLHAQVIGGLNLFRCRPGPLSDTDLAIAGSFATAATIAVLHTRAKNSRDVVNEQLQHALDSRVIIEQAKGYLAERHRESLSEAFSRLRSHARNHNQRLTSVAREVVGGTLDLV